MLQSQLVPRGGPTRLNAATCLHRRSRHELGRAVSGDQPRASLHVSTSVVGWYGQRECDTTACMDLVSLVMCLSSVLCADINIGWRYKHHDAKEHELELFSFVGISD